MKIEKYFSVSDREKIRQAVAAAEKKTSAEIVTYFRESSDYYEEALWRAGALFALLAGGAIFCLRHFTSVWFEIEALQSGMIIAAGGLSGVFLAFLIPSIRRLFIGKHRLAETTMLRAREAFLTQEVFNTDGRTGILIFLSLFERRVIVLGDTEINQRTDSRDWIEATELIVTGMKSSRCAEGLILAIERCGEILLKSGLVIQKGDRNELPDNIRSGDRT